MTLKFNNSDVQNVLFNGTQLEKLQLNGVTVWEHAQPVPGGTVIFEGTTPGTFDVTIPAPGIYYCTVVGGGGGAALSMHTTAHNAQTAMPSVGSLVCGGGTGAYISASVNFDRVTELKVTVGDKGVGHHTYQLDRVTGNTWYVYGGAGGDSMICSEITKVVLKANGGGRGKIDGKIVSSHTGNTWYSDFTVSTGAGGGRSWNNQTGITLSNVNAAQGNVGNLAENGWISDRYGSFTAESVVKLAPNMVSGYGAGGGGRATTNRVSNGTDNANWNYDQGTYGPNVGYVKIVKA